MSKRKKRKTGRFLALLILLAVIGLISVSSWYTSTLKTPFIADGTQRVKFDIKTGDTARDIVSNLKNADLIRSESALLWYIRQEKIGDQFKAGSYVLQQNMAPLDIITDLTNDIGGEEWITLLEGWSNHQIAEYLSERDWGTYEEITDCMKTCEFDHGFLSWKPEGRDLEGFLYPDSYIITREYIPKNILKRLLDTFDQKTATLREEAANQGKNFYDILIMASMIEKEVRGMEDKKIVSGVLWKRLEYGIPLGVDATVLYARGYWEGPITQSDLQIDSPYNTRKNAGLPPGPISNPSLESIQAALYPTESEYYFYITEPVNGNVIYGKTLEEHNQNVYEYLR